MIRLFEGKEAEGIFSGKWTLFVSGNVPFSKIVNFRKTHRQIYFGADGRSPINWETVRKCLDRLPCTITAEVTVPVPRDIALDPEFHVIVFVQVDEIKLQSVLESVEIMQERVQLKFDSEMNSWLFPMTGTLTNERSEILGDKELWKDSNASAS